MGSVSGRDSAVCCRCIVLSSFIFHILHLTFTLVFQHTMTCIWYYEKYTTKWHESELADDSKRVQYNMIQSTKYESDSGLVWSSTPLLLWEPKLYQLLLNPSLSHILATKCQICDSHRGVQLKEINKGNNSLNIQMTLLFLHTGDCSYFHHIWVLSL